MLYKYHDVKGKLEQKKMLYRTSVFMRDFLHLQAALILSHL